MFNISAYGLRIQSEFPLLDDSINCFNVSSDQPDVSVHLSSLSGLKSEDYQSSNSILGTLRGVARFLICNGNEIIIDPESGVEEKTLSTSILCSAMSVILRQRGFLVLHASCILIDGKAIAFIGPSGAGKSTIASTFYTLGYPVITDDVLAIQFIDGFPFVRPSFPIVKLLPDSAIALGHQLEHLPPLNELSPKRIQYVNSENIAGEYPLKNIYVLDIGDKHQVSAIIPSKALLVLIYNSRSIKTLVDVESKDQHFQQCSSLVNTTSIFLLKRKRTLRNLSEIVSLVKEELNEREQRTGNS